MARGRELRDPVRASRRARGAWLAVAALAASLAVGVPAAGSAAKPALPAHGVLASGTSLGGVRLGDTLARVRTRWGDRYSRCTICAPATLLFTYPGRAYPSGAAVSFRRGRVTAIFTIGTPSGWRTREGVRLGAPTARALDVYGRLAYTRCIGYAALSMRSAAAVTSIYTYGESVYGFALTRPSEPICQ